MRLKFTLFSLLLLSYTANAQKLTGIWRGYFSSSSGIYRENIREETYKYEIQIDQQTNNGVRGVTYSYKSTVFYGKAEINGIFTGASKSLIIKEIKLVELKMADKSEPCLMTCYLDYSKIGKLEILEGTFISTNVKDKSDCGSGKVYLERVTTSDFKKEDFLLKKKEDTVAKIKPAVPKSIIPAPPATRRDNLTTKPVPLASQNKPQQKPAAVPSTKNNPATNNKKPDLRANAGSGKNSNPAVKEDKPVVQNKIPEKTISETPIITQKEPQTVQPSAAQVERQRIPVPRVLVERENALVQTINVSDEDVQIAFFDNGEIDNDTITVYHNNELVVNKGRLSDKPIIVKIKCSKTDNHHELVVVAENLGDIPPNTAMLVITSGKEGRNRKEIFVASNERKNAKVVINFVPKE